MKSNSTLALKYLWLFCFTLPLFSEEKTALIPPDVPSFSLTYDKQFLHCSPVKRIQSKTHKDRVEYHCVGTDPKSIETKKKILTTEKRGRSETDRLRVDLENKHDEGVSYTVTILHADALRPRLAANIAKRQLENKFYGKALSWILPARFYISIRPQFSSISESNGLKYRNGGTRGGFYYYYKFDSAIELMTQYEAKIRDKDNKAFIDFADITNSSRRLSYLSLTYENYTLLYGKYWSAYYDIASFTDYFMAFGKQGTGAFNHGGDGSESGTGRTDNMLQFHTKISDFEVSAQYQFSHNGPTHFDTTYSYSVAGSLVYNGVENITFGAAFAFAKFDTITPLLRSFGIEGEDRSFIAGVQYDLGKYGVAANFSYSQNHMGDDQGAYFDALGAELYVHYDFTNNIRIAGGGNWILPKDNNYAGKYSIQRGILSLQYTFGDATFDDLVYIELTLPKGHLANGETIDPNIAIGLRYLFDLH